MCVRARLAACALLKYAFMQVRACTTASTRVCASGKARVRAPVCAVTCMCWRVCGYVVPHSVLTCGACDCKCKRTPQAVCAWFYACMHACMHAHQCWCQRVCLCVCFGRCGVRGRAWTCVHTFMLARAHSHKTYVCDAVSTRCDRHMRVPAHIWSDTYPMGICMQHQEPPWCDT